MSSTLTYTDPAAVTPITDLAGSAPTLKNLANNGYILTNEIDPGGTPPLYSNYRLDMRGTTPTKGQVAKCWYVRDVGDAGVYDITSGTNTPTRAPDFVFYGFAITTQQSLQSVPGDVRSPASPHKILIQNVSNANWTNVDAENVLYASAFSEIGSS